MERVNAWSIAVLLLTVAVPVHASTWSIGAGAGFDILSSNGNSAVVVGAPTGNDILSTGVHPGLRLGMTDDTQHHSVFSDLGLLLYSNSGFSLHSVQATVNYAYAFQTGTSPYVTVGAGFGNVGDENSSTTLTLYGAGVGGRHRLPHGHGAVRIEGRFDRATESAGGDLNVIGVRFGFDLDFN